MSARTDSRQGVSRHVNQPARQNESDLFLVEDALVEARREADIGDVAGVEVDTAAHLAACDGAVLTHVGLEQMGGLDGDGTAWAGHEEVRTDVAPQVRQAEWDARPQSIELGRGHVGAGHTGRDPRDRAWRRRWW